MHELFVLDETLPVDPGKSPFQVRGVIYGRTVEHAKKIAGSLEAFARQLKDERVARFITQPFRWNGLYDALPMSPVQIVLSRLQGQDFEVATRKRSADGARELIPRMFRLVLGFTRPRSWALHAPRLMSEYCGYGDMSPVDVRDTGAVFEVANIPQFVAASHANTVIGIFEGSLSALGASNVSIGYFDVKRAGEREGLPMLSYKLDLKWS